MKDKITVTVDGQKKYAEPSTVLAEIISCERPCGGHGKCGKCKVLVNGREELACSYIVRSDIEVITKGIGNIHIETGVEEKGEISDNLCFALDIGTTTLALALVSLDRKEVVRVLTASNPQRKFGADIMTRIEYCQKNSVGELHRVIVERINEMLAEFKVGKLKNIFVSANVTMLHTLFGIDCSSMGTAPYTPSFLDYKEESAEALGLIGVEKVISLPSISSFVGADIVAGLNYIGMPEAGKYNLLVDLGTNAEIVLYSPSSGLATAAAAGPCFEGANISYGMSATDGAIYAFELNNGEAVYKTIENKKPVGICGTGLIDIISELLKNGVIEETGFMEEDYIITEDVILSREDVRRYQLAKSAIYSAIHSLIKSEGVNFDDISALYISGGFSSKINVKNAANSGLIPKELVQKTHALNNTSLQGVIKFACGENATQSFVKLIKSVDLSQNQYFNTLFIENMLFDIGE